MVSLYHWKPKAGFLILGMLLLIVINAVVPAFPQEQEEGYSSQSLFIALFANGDALVEYEVGIDDPRAEEIRIELFGEDISNLILVDYEDNAIQFQTGETTNEIIANRPNASNIKISYTTPDFVSKDRREWIFTLDSAINFSVKLPPGSILTDPGENPSIVLMGDQQLLTYNPGNIRFVYVIGTLGTEEQANIVIKAAETTITQIDNSHSGIVLTAAEELLQRAIAARDDGWFTDAERLADQANGIAISTARDYEAAQKSITDVEEQMAMAVGNVGRNDAEIRQVLDQAKNEFAIGNYLEARSSAEVAITSITNDEDGESDLSEIPIPVIIVAAAAGGAGFSAMKLLKMRKQKNLQPQLQEVEGPNTMPSNNDNNIRRDVGIFPSISTPITKVDRRQGGGEEKAVFENRQDILKSLRQTHIHQKPDTISDSLIDGAVLSHIVDKILYEKPDLRPEDQQVLKFLVEKEGAAFESEIRSKFQLPKTTIWRLVKRLEREELVEIRKAAGQNLIKLKFEDKQA